MAKGLEILVSLFYFHLLDAWKAVKLIIIIEHLVLNAIYILFERRSDSLQENLFYFI